jgi:hypothetical protein
VPGGPRRHRRRRRPGGWNRDGHLAGRHRSGHHCAGPRWALYRRNGRHDAGPREGPGRMLPRHPRVQSRICQDDGWAGRTACHRLAPSPAGRGVASRRAPAPRPPGWTRTRQGPGCSGRACRRPMRRRNPLGAAGRRALFLPAARPRNRRGAWAGTARRPQLPGRTRPGAAGPPARLARMPGGAPGWAGKAWGRPPHLLARYAGAARRRARPPCPWGRTRLLPGPAGTASHPLGQGLPRCGAASRHALPACPSRVTRAHRHACLAGMACRPARGCRSLAARLPAGPSRLSHRT